MNILTAENEESATVQALDGIAANFPRTPLVVHKPQRCDDEGRVHDAIASVLRRAKLESLRLVGFNFNDDVDSGSFQAIAVGINGSTTTLKELTIEDCCFGEDSTELLKGLKVVKLSIGRLELKNPYSARSLFQALLLGPRPTVKHISLLPGCEFYHVQTIMPMVRDSKLESLLIDLGDGNKHFYTLVEQIPKVMIKKLEFRIDGAKAKGWQHRERERLLQAFHHNMTIESLTITSYDDANSFWSPGELLRLQSYAEENRQFNALLREAGAMDNHVWPDRIAAVNQRRNDSFTALFHAVKALAPNRGAFSLE